MEAVRTIGAQTRVSSRRRRPMPVSRLLVVVWCAALALACAQVCPRRAHALAWDRTPAATPQRSFHAAIRVPLDARTFLRTTDEATSAWTGTVAATARRCEETSAASLLIAMGGLDDANEDQSTIFLLPWPLSTTRSGQQRWQTAPLVGSQPAARDSFGFVAAAESSPLAGRAFVFGGATSEMFLASLWVLDLRTTGWTPLGPSRLVDDARPAALDCDGRETYAHDGTVLTAASTSAAVSATVDACYYPSIGLAQTDEFGCAWPSSRQAHSTVVIDDAIYIFGGLLISQEAVGDVWRLRLDANLTAALSQQATSSGGVYVANEDQLKYRIDPADPTISRERLCPVKWELLTRPDGTASLANLASSAPFPAARYFHSATVSGAAFWVIGGSVAWGSAEVRGDVWTLDTQRLAWTQIEPAALASGFNPAARTLHASFAVYLASIADFVADPTDPAIAACATDNTTAIIVGPYQPGGAADMWLLVPNCSSLVLASDVSDACAASAPINASSATSWSWVKAAVPSAAASPQPPFAAAWMQMTDQRILAIGGLTSESTVSDVTQVYDLVGQTASTLAAPSANPARGPQPFTRSSAFLVNRTMWVIGKRQLFANANIYTYNVDSLAWSAVSTPWEQRDLPTPNQIMWATTESALTTVNGTHLLAFGGADMNNLTSIDDVELSCTGGLYAFELSTKTWTNQTGMLTSSTPWSESAEAAADTGGVILDGFIYPLSRCWSQGAVVDGGRTLLMFGGDVNTSSFSRSPSDNALWSLDLHTLSWTLLQRTNRSVALDDAAAGRPGPRKGHSLLAVDDERVVVMFGTDPTIAATKYSAAAWVYYRTTHSWRLLRDGIHDGMVGRIRAATTLYRGGAQAACLLVFGGQPLIGAVTNNLFSIEIDDLYPVFHRDFPAGTIPAARSGASLLSLDDTREVMLYGGLSTDSVVHVLAMDDATVGTNTTAHVAHDWIGAMQLSRSVVFDLPTDHTDRAPLVPVAAASGSFSTIAGALAHFQPMASGASAATVITVLDNDVHSSAHTTSFLDATNTIIYTNVTIRGRREHASRSLLDCSGHTVCHLFVAAPAAAVSSACSSLTNGPLLQLRDVVIRNGRSASSGGALRIINARANLTNVVLEGAAAYGAYGGAVMIENGRVALDRTSVTSNTARLAGGGIFAINSFLTIANSNITNNTLSVGSNSSAYTLYGQGGGLAATSTTLTLAADTHFIGNRARAGGGLAAAVFQTWFPGAASSAGLCDGSISATGVKFDRNVATGYGGAVFLSQLGDGDDAADEAAYVDQRGDDGGEGQQLPSFSNCIFSSNAAGASGGAVRLDGTRGVFNATRFVANECGPDGSTILWTPTHTDTTAILTPIFINQPPVTTNVTDGPLSACTLIASPAVSLRLTSASLAAAATSQNTGFLVTPTIGVYLVDAFGQIVDSNNDTFITVGPSYSLAGTTTVRTVRGVALFDQLIFRGGLASVINLTFTASALLLQLQRDVDRGLLALALTSSADAASGLLAVTNSTLSQVATCSSGCTVTLPTVSGARATCVEIVFDTTMFCKAYDTLTITMSRGFGKEVVATFRGDEIVQLAAERTSTETLAVHRSDWNRIPSPSAVAKTIVASSYTVYVEVPSSSVSLKLQTSNDLLGFLTGRFNTSRQCPDGMQLTTDTQLCLTATRTYPVARATLIACSVAVFLIVVVAAVITARHRHTAAIRAGSLPLSAAMITYIALLPIASMFYALDSLNLGVCLARSWLTGISICGVVSLLLAKSLRMRSLARSSSLKSRLVSDSQLMLVVCACLACEAILLVVATAANMCTAEWRTFFEDNEPRAFLECTLRTQNGSTAWLIVQWSYGLVLGISAGVAAFQSRRIAPTFNESTHTALALGAFVVLVMILVPTSVLTNSEARGATLMIGAAITLLAFLWTIILVATKLYQVRVDQQRVRAKQLAYAEARRAARVTATAMRKQPTSRRSRLRAIGRQAESPAAPPIEESPPTNQAARGSRNSDFDSVESDHEDDHFAAIASIDHESAPSDHPASHAAHSFVPAAAAALASPASWQQIAPIHAAEVNHVRVHPPDDACHVPQPHGAQGFPSPVRITYHGRPAHLHYHRSFTFDASEAALSSAADYIAHFELMPPAAAVADGSTHTSIRSSGVDDDEPTQEAPSSDADVRTDTHEGDREAVQLTDLSSMQVSHLTL